MTRGQNRFRVSDHSVDPYQTLAAAVIRQAVDDASGQTETSTPKREAEARAWLAGDVARDVWLELICPEELPATTVQRSILERLDRGEPSAC